jgi:hypothetical protein
LSETGRWHEAGRRDIPRFSGASAPFQYAWGNTMRPSVRVVASTLVRTVRSGRGIAGDRVRRRQRERIRRCGGGRVALERIGMEPPDRAATLGTNTACTSVKAFSATDVWAVGDTSTSNVAMTLAVHYNGSGWTRTPTPSPGTRNNAVTAVDGTAANDVWAVGYSLNLP